MLVLIAQMEYLLALDCSMSKLDKLWYSLGKWLSW